MEKLKSEGGRSGCDDTADDAGAPCGISAGRPQLATLTPGTTQSTNPVSFFNGAPSSEASTRGSFSLSVGGSREQSTDWLLDGNDNNQLDEGGISNT